MKQVSKSQSTARTGGQADALCQFDPRSPGPRARDVQEQATRGGDLRALAVCRMVAARHGVTFAEIFQPSRSRAAIASVRQLAMYMVHTLAERSLTETGEFFGRDRTTVAYACALIEDQRDDPDIDAELLAVEHRLLALFEDAGRLAAVAAGGDNDE